MYWYEGSNNVSSGVAVTMTAADNLYVAQGVTVGSTGFVSDAIDGAGSIYAAIYGALFSMGADGLYSSDGDNQITVGAAGSVSGFHFGMFLSGGGNLVVNDGSITGGGAVDFSGAGNNSLINTGQLSGIHDDTVVFFQGGNTISNSGTISSIDHIAIAIASSNTDAANTIDNSGTISVGSGLNAIVTQSGAASLSNSGHISGSIVFGGAASVANQGTIEGVLALDTADGTTDTIANSGTIAVPGSSGAAINDVGTGTLNVTNKGDIASNGGNGISFNVASGTDTLHNSGTIESSGSSTAVEEQNTGALSVTNSGEIDGGSFGVVFQTTSGTDTLDNTGMITGSLNAVRESGSADLTVVNSGTISGQSGIVFDGAVDSLDNSGTIRSNVAGGYAISEVGGSLDIANSGHIAGGVIFFGANNVYDGALGSVSGWVTGGSGTNTFTGGAGTDHFDGGAGVVALDGMGGNDVLMAEGTQATIDGGDGNDTINMASFFNASDQIDGGDGKDILTLDGNYSTGVVLGSNTLTNVEKIVLSDGFKYVLTTDDATVAAGAALTVDASAMTGGNTLNFNGSAETDGHFVISGSAGNDVIVGGAGNDVLTGNGGNNLFTGGLGADHIVTIGGHDHFIYNDVSESTGLAHDVITNFSATTGKFDLDVTVTGINSEVASGRLSTANFDANLASAVGSAQLGAGHAVLFTPTIGNLAGHTYLIVDANGVAGYQAGQDYVFELVGATHLTSLATADFI